MKNGRWKMERFPGAVCVVEFPRTTNRTGSLSHRANGLVFVGERKQKSGIVLSSVSIVSRGLV